jgi:hypothetical protein
VASLTQLPGRALEPHQGAETLFGGEPQILSQNRPVHVTLVDLDDGIRLERKALLQHVAPF